MRAARLYGIADLRVEDVPPPPAPEGDGVLVRVAAAGICGSDLHNFRTGQWISRVPSTPGHELSGEVVTVGADVAGLRPGDRVVADSRYWCGTCRQCTHGHPHLCETLGYVGEVCDGGFAEALILPERLLFKVDAALDPAVAAMAEPLAVALHAVDRLQPEAGEPVLVAGCGPIGALAALLLARRGGRVLVADRNEARRASVAAATGARPAALDKDAAEAAAGGPLRYAIDATGSVAALAALIDIVTNGATVAAVGIFHERLDIDPSLIVERELSLKGCSAFADEMPDAIALLPALAEDLQKFIGETVGLDDIPAAYERLIGGRAPGLKTIVRPG
jgi:(R,R)-butanediol dehydrogenase/meso-butanediol dehydrogenase/diacetyl reductase